MILSETLESISLSYPMFTGRDTKVMLLQLRVTLLFITLQRRLRRGGSTRIHLWFHLISPQSRRIPAGLNATDTLWVACMHRLFYILRWPPEPAFWLMFRVESGRDWACEDISGSIDHFQQFWNGYHHINAYHVVLIEWFN